MVVMAGVGRAFRARQEDVDALLERASADSSSHATRRSLWEPATSTLPHRHSAEASRSIWEDTGAIPAPLRRS